jgi:hypothetical protein
METISSTHLESNQYNTHLSLISTISSTLHQVGLARRKERILAWHMFLDSRVHGKFSK